MAYNPLFDAAASGGGGGGGGARGGMSSLAGLPPLPSLDLSRVSYAAMGGSAPGVDCPQLSSDEEGDGGDSGSESDGDGMEEAVRQAKARKSLGGSSAGGSPNPLARALAVASEDDGALAPLAAEPAAALVGSTMNLTPRLDNGASSPVSARAHLRMLHGAKAAAPIPAPTPRTGSVSTSQSLPPKQHQQQSQKQQRELEQLRQRREALTMEVKAARATSALVSDDDDDPEMVTLRKRREAIAAQRQAVAGQLAAAERLPQESLEDATPQARWKRHERQIWVDEATPTPMHQVTLDDLLTHPGQQQQQQQQQQPSRAYAQPQQQTAPPPPHAQHHSQAPSPHNGGLGGLEGCRGGKPPVPPLAVGEAQRLGGGGAAGSGQALPYSTQIQANFGPGGRGRGVPPMQLYFRQLEQQRQQQQQQQQLGYYEQDSFRSAISDLDEMVSARSDSTLASTYRSAVGDEGGDAAAAAAALLKKAFKAAARNKPNRLRKLLPVLRGGPLATNESGNTLLMVAARYGNREIVSMLLSSGAGALLNAQNKSGHTVLHMAFAGGHHELADALMGAGADDNIECAEGLSCYDYAA